MRSLIILFAIVTIVSQAFGQRQTIRIPNEEYEKKLDSYVKNADIDDDDEDVKCSRLAYCEGKNITEKTANREIIVNGCGSTSIPFDVPDFKWGDCCNLHDYCFSSCRYSFTYCNVAFRSCMYAVCENEDFTSEWSCKAGAKLYYGVVNSDAGCTSFKEGSADHCKC